MKAVLLSAPFKLELKDIEKPVPGDHDVLVKVEATGICGSDLHTYRGTHPFRIPPLFPGHEFAGRVTDVGKKVNNIQIGDSVTVEPWTHCGKCDYCLEGRTNLCSNKVAMGTNEWKGSFAEYVVSPESLVYKLPSEVSYEEGALIEPLAASVHAVRRSEVKLGETALVFGAGTIGLGILLFLNKAGISKTIITDIDDFNLSLAKQLGATRTVNVIDESIYKVVHEITSGKGVDIVIIAAGVKNLVQEATRIIKKNGKIIVIAIFDEMLPVDMFKIVNGEHNIRGSWAYTKKDFDIVMNFIALRKINPKPLITHHFSLNETNKAFTILDQRSEKVVKILFTF